MVADSRHIHQIVVDEEEEEAFEQEEEAIEEEEEAFEQEEG
jgi:hypothetical protein